VSSCFLSVLPHELLKLRCILAKPGEPYKINGTQLKLHRTAVPNLFHANANRLRRACR